MALPGFSAESSLGPTAQTYRVVSSYGVAHSQHLVPQQDMADGADDALVDEHDGGDEVLDDDTGDFEETETDEEEVET